MTTDPLRNKPRVPQDHGAVSLLLGGWTPEAAGECIRSHGALNDGTDAARYTTAASLRSSGFVVTHTPSRGIPEHVSVTSAAWDAEAFHACFGPVQEGTPPADGLDEEEVSK